MANELTAYPSLNGKPTTNAGIPLISGTIPLTELGQFSKASVTASPAVAETIIAMTEYTLLEIVQDGVGTIYQGYVVDPVQQITASDASSVTFELEPLTEECLWRTMHRGWVANNKLSIVAYEIATTVPGWTGGFTGQGTADDIEVAVTLNDNTATDAFLSTAKKFGQYARLGVDANDAPTRLLEMGQFGAAAVVCLTSVNGGDLDSMSKNGLIRIPATIEYRPNNVRDLVNVVTPFGGGSNDSLVTLERLWRIVNDPTYVNFGRYGPDADSLARTGLKSLFPEYDPYYPISDPENFPTGKPLWYSIPPGGTVPAPLAAGHNVYVFPYGGVQTAFEYDANNKLVVNATPILMQGQSGTRYPTRDGHWDYMCYDFKSYFGSDTNPAYGYKGGQFIDSSIVYTDPSIGNQELTERALYLNTVANFKRRAHPHQTFTCTVVDPFGRPTHAGDLISVDYQRQSTGERGTTVEMNVVKTYRVMSVTRTFSDAAPPVDTYILSSLGRFDETDATGAAYTANQMIALAMNKGTSIAPMRVYGAGNVDGLHPLVVPVDIPDELYNWHKCTLRLDFQPFAATSTTSDNQTQDFNIQVASQDIILDAPNDINLGGTFNADGTGATGTTDGFDLVQTGVDNDAVVQILVSNDGGNLPLGSRLNAQLQTSPTNPPRWRMSSGALPDNTPMGANMKINFAKQQTKSAFTTPILQNVVKKFGSIARIPAFAILAQLPHHKHGMIYQVGGPVASSAYIEIDNGGGYTLLSQGVQITSGSRNADGTFSSSVAIADVSKFVFAPGKTVFIRVTPLINAGDAANPYGAGRFVVSGTWFGEWGGIATTVQYG